jgi:site-specific DNA-cytosine methylase
VTSSTSGRPVALLAGGVKKGAGNLTRRRGSGMEYEDPSTGKKKSGGELGRYRLSVAECCELQGLPRNFFEKSPFLQDSLRQMLANAVPFHLSMAVADAIARALGMAGREGHEFLDHRCYETGASA